MQVKIRAVAKSWHPGYEYEWQPDPSSNGKWYQLWSKSILRYPYGDAQLRRRAGIEAMYIMNALIQGVPVQCRATYDRHTHKLFIMHNGGDTEQ